MTKLYQRERVETDDRRAMTPARKRRIWSAWDGKCWFCRMPVPESGPGVVYDHVNPLWIKGSDADQDIGPIHALPCNKLKTAADLTRIAKTKRQAKLCEPTEPSKRPIQSRGFDTRLTKGFDGRVRPRTTGLCGDPCPPMWLQDGSAEAKAKGNGRG